MLAEDRGPDPQTSGAPRRPSAAGKNVRKQRGGKNQRQASSQRISCLGLEVKPELVWRNWDSQKEFTKTLVLKNIHNKLQKLHVRPPVSKFFTTVIPQTIAVSPGTSFSVPVTFRPLQRCEYEDSLEFQGKECSFQVCLRATIPCYSLEVPESVLLPLCAVQHSTHATFLLRNVSKLQTCFQWECTEPFQLSPEQGLLQPTQECQITVVFQPQEALVYQEHAYCWFGEDMDKAQSCCTVLLQGPAKYPCLQLRNPGTTDEKQQWDPVLHFGSVVLGKSLQKHFDICNPSPVKASFSLSLLSNRVPLLGSEFSCDVTSGEVVPGRSLRATVAYTPAEVDTVAVEYFCLKCRGAPGETLLRVTGNCVGPEVSLSSSLVDFGCIDDGGTGVQTVELVNVSPAEAEYQWDLDSSGHSVFSIHPASGTLHPHSQTTLKAIYRPTQPFAHHRRVACLILHRDPIFLDLIGTCHSKLQQPVVLKPEHLVQYQLQWCHRQNSQHTLKAVQQDHKEGVDQQGVESHQRPDSVGDVSRTPMEEYYQSCLGWMDPLSTTSSLSSLHVSVVPIELLLNHKTSSLVTEATSSQFVSVTNHTRGKLSLVWTAAPDSPFSVSPSSCDLAPLKSTSFTVTYEPKRLNTLHAAQLECFAYPKDNHTEEPQLCPPWCVTVRVIGHSFQPSKEHFLPHCSLKPPRVVFPALSVLSYRTALLQNCGDLPLTFFVDHSSNPAFAETVSVVPRCGLVHPGSHQILTLRTTPTEDSPKQGFSIHLQLNAAKNTKELTVVSVVENLCVSLEGDGNLYFQPTAVDSRTQRPYHISNLSHLPLRFQWNIPEPDQELIFVEPDAGELHPNESLAQMWFFSPMEEKTYTLRPTLTFWPIQTPGCDKSELALTVVGMGSKGFIEAEKALLDVGEIPVGSYRSVEVPLVNKSPCSVSFSLSVQQILLDEDPVDGPETEPSALELDCERGTIASHSTVLLRSTLKPQRGAQYLWTISYQTLNASGFSSSPPQAVCEVRAKAVFPTLKVTDVSGSGSLGKLTKVHLWELLSLDNLNEHLLSSPSPAELTYRTPSKYSPRSCPSIFTKVILDLNFSAAPLNSDPSTFVLMFHNPGSLPADWAFLLPEDQEIELEYLAETGVFSSTELNQMKLQDNHLFSVSPRSGTLHPGQQRAVKFSYSHEFAGTDQFPVIFKLSFGREILLIFKGVTLERDRSSLYFPSKQHVFTSVSIGDASPPRQVYEIHNNGAVPVCYEVDSAVLSQLQVDNFNHPVLRCLNPKGEVLPGQTAVLEWIFSPLEVKMYHMDIPIHVPDGDSTLVRFEGCGLRSPVASKNCFSCCDIKASEERVQRMPFPGQVVFLSEDTICLGDIPVCSQSSRLLFLTNLSHTDTVLYKWDKSTQVVMIHPEHGSLCPGESALCVLTFTSTDYPTCYRLDVICQIIREAALTQYHDALQRWEKEKERQRDEFIITDKKLSQSRPVLIDEEPGAAPVRKGAPSRKYKTLPPIGASGSCEPVSNMCRRTMRAECRAKQETAKLWRRPQPPQPALLHLAVTAHSHRLLEYLTHFPDQLDKHDRCLPSFGSRQPEAKFSSTSLPLGLPSLTHGDEKDITLHVLSSLLWCILDDPAFTHWLQEPHPSHCSSVQSHLHHPSHPTSALSNSQRQGLLSGTVAGQREQHNIVEKEGTAGCSGYGLQTQSTPHTDIVPADISEEVLLNTLQKVMMEAVTGELVLTAHPRSIILPPVSKRKWGSSKATAKEEKENLKTTEEPGGILLTPPIHHSATV